MTNAEKDADAAAYYMKFPEELLLDSLGYDENPRFSCDFDRYAMRLVWDVGPARWEQNTFDPETPLAKLVSSMAVQCGQWIYSSNAFVRMLAFALIEQGPNGSIPREEWFYSYIWNAANACSDSSKRYQCLAAMWAFACRWFSSGENPPDESTCPSMEYCGAHFGSGLGYLFDNHNTIDAVCLVLNEALGVEVFYFYPEVCGVALMKPNILRMVHAIDHWHELPRSPEDILIKRLLRSFAADHLCDKMYPSYTGSTITEVGVERFSVGRSLVGLACIFRDGDCTDQIHEDVRVTTSYLVWEQLVPLLLNVAGRNPEEEWRIIALLTLFRTTYTSKIEGIWYRVAGSCEALVQYLNSARLLKQTDPAYPGKGHRARSCCDVIGIIEVVCADESRRNSGLAARFIRAGFLEVAMAFTNDLHREQALGAVANVLRCEASRQFVSRPVFGSLLTLARPEGSWFSYPAMHLVAVSKFANAVTWYCPFEKVSSDVNTPLRLIFPLELVGQGLAVASPSSIPALLALARDPKPLKWKARFDLTKLRTWLYLCFKNLFRLPKKLKSRKAGAVCAAGFALTKLGKLQDELGLLDAMDIVATVGASLALWKYELTATEYPFKCLLAGIITASLRVQGFAAKMRSNPELARELATRGLSAALADRDVAEFWYWAAYNLEQRASGTFSHVVWSSAACFYTVTNWRGDKRVLHRMFRFFDLLASRVKEPDEVVQRGIPLKQLQALVRGCAADAVFIDAMLRAIPLVFTDWPDPTKQFLT
jgi:hypothetical protein